ncbi:hypothetical protein F4804DRAFT_344400 [Jackrogersella minutella]|nr:hypothetical protein F4804DRAFT_344400 [Jackrogersella minutella]
MNPYETDPAKIPATDLHAYGVIFSQCTPANRMYDVEGWGDVFALGSVIVKSSHLSAAPPHRDHTWSDANEPVAIALASDALREIGIRVPTIYFQGKINQRSIVIQARIPEVGLNVAWPYLAHTDKVSFKQQARKIIKKLEGVPRPSTMDATASSYVVPDPDPVRNRGSTETVYDLLFGDRDDGKRLGFVHNDFDESNIIVQDGKIVGLIDWEMAGIDGITF